MTARPESGGRGGLGSNRWYLGLGREQMYQGALHWVYHGAAHRDHGQCQQWCWLEKKNWWISEWFKMVYLVGGNDLFGANLGYPYSRQRFTIQWGAVWNLIVVGKISEHEFNMMIYTIVFDGDMEIQWISWGHDDKQFFGHPILGQIHSCVVLSTSIWWESLKILLVDSI